MTSIEDWLWYSVRRSLLDQDLDSMHTAMIGRVLEIGATKGRRRGEFVPPTNLVNEWITLDRYAANPHVRADLAALPFGAKRFDTLVCLEVLEYVERPPHALSEMKRILKIGGKLILATPFLHRMDSQFDYWRFTEGGLRFLLGEAGFRIEDLKSQGAALAVAVNILKYVLRVQTPGWRRAWLLAVGRPLLTWLLNLDANSIIAKPVLGSFSTGYLVLAEAQ